MSTELFTRLAGRWAIARNVTPQGSLAGVADFTPREDGWIAYRETGELKLPQGTYPAERRYLFEPMRDGFAVWFDAEPLRLFHRIRLDALPDGTLRGEAEHPCGRDTYLTTYIIPPKDGFSIRHRVTGPNKNYTVETAYERSAVSRKEIAA